MILKVLVINVILYLGKMVRNYKKTPGTRHYKNYTDETLEEALQKVTNGDLSINAASVNYKIPFGTLYNRYKGMHGSTPGGQPVFTYVEEVAILKAAATCADWGFPLTSFDLRMFAKTYLDQHGRYEAKFKNNIPGIDWAMSVLKRHNNAYGQRVATNIKRARAAVGRESINAYFDNLEKVIENVPPSNIFNYDESNLSDDPGKKKCIYRRGVKYPEKVMNHSKSCTSIMICGSADGTLLPPYVIYKSLHLYDTWKEGGIAGYPCCQQPCCSRGSRYNRTASGWIDASTFRDWFLTCFLPHANRLEGQKVLIGDNLSSHLDSDVLETCQSHNISFVCLVPNSTHICQPLDVSFFRPMKAAWRKTLEQWKHSNPKASAVPKDVFPRLLRENLIEMDKVQTPSDANEEFTSAIKRNLISGFNATGIYPLNRAKVLNKIPASQNEAEVTAAVRDSLTDFLKEQRFGKDSEPTRKKKRLAVEPGKSISTIDEPEPSTSTTEAEPLNILPINKPGIDENILEDNINQLFLRQSVLDNDDDTTDCESVTDGQRTQSDNIRRPKTGEFILAKFNSAKGKKIYQYVCMVEENVGDKLVVLGFKSHKKNKTIFKAVENDVSIIDQSDVIAYLPKPKLESDLYIFPQNIDVKEL